MILERLCCFVGFHRTTRKTAHDLSGSESCWRFVCMNCRATWFKKRG